MALLVSRVPHVALRRGGSWPWLGAGGSCVWRHVGQHVGQQWQQRQQGQQGHGSRHASTHPGIGVDEEYVCIGRVHWRVYLGRRVDMETVLHTPWALRFIFLQLTPYKG